MLIADKNENKLEFALYGAACSAVATAGASVLSKK